MATYWLFKTNPEMFSYDDLERTDAWPWQISRAAARRLAHALGPCSLSFIFHAGSEQAIVGVAEVLTAPYADPPRIDVAARGRLGRPISLVELKQNPEFAAWELLRHPRLAIVPVNAAIWERVLQLAQR